MSDEARWDDVDLRQALEDATGRIEELERDQSRLRSYAEELEAEIEAYKAAIHVCVASVGLRAAIHNGVRAVLGKGNRAMLAAAPKQL